MMLRLLQPWAISTKHALSRPPQPSWYSTKASDPLRILFCGSDEFSCQSLRALHREQSRNKTLVESLDVMVLPGKRVGRGLKQIRQVPCLLLAEELGLRIHQRETFRGWSLPGGINLVVVVSFGLFVPPRILEAAKYGGLNVHPSMLPDLRGPAPIHHALLRGDQRVGVSLQTLHPRLFDHGTVLAQTPRPGLPVPPSATLPQLTAALGAAGAQMLVEGLREGAHVPPLVDVGWASQGSLPVLTHAGKVGKEDAQVEWEAWDGEALRRRIRVFGMAWTRGVDAKGGVRRVLLLDGEPVDEVDEVKGVEARIVLEAETQEETRAERQHERVVRVDETSGSVCVPMRGGWVRLRRVKVDGKPEQDATTGLRPFLRMA